LSGFLQKSFCIILLVGITAVVCWPMLQTGYVNGHSSGLYVIWAQQFLKSLYAGDYRVLSWQPEHCTLELNTDVPAFLFLRTSYYPVGRRF